MSARRVDTGNLADAVASGDRRSLARAVTLVESTREDHRDQAVALLEILAPRAGGAVRLGISGAPGVGKSTFIEAFGRLAIAQGRRLAVLAVDPSSALSGGSILGDKTRMGRLAREPDAFIRPSPAGGTPGGVARRTPEVLMLCEAAGYDLVVVETVGVGQSETAVAAMVDTFLVLVLPGAGDELQGIKRGIMELADLVLVNKADGDLAGEAERTAAEYANALRLLRRRGPGWDVRVETCSALTGAGVASAFDRVLERHAALQATGELEGRRAAQASQRLWSEVSHELREVLARDKALAKMLAGLETEVAGGRLPPTVAAARVVERLIASKHS